MYRTVSIHPRRLMLHQMAARNKRKGRSKASESAALGTGNVKTVCVHLFLSRDAEPAVLSHCIRGLRRPILNAYRALRCGRACQSKVYKVTGVRFGEPSLTIQIQRAVSHSRSALPYSIWENVVCKMSRMTGVAECSSVDWESYGPCPCLHEISQYIRVSMVGWVLGLL